MLQDTAGHREKYLIDDILNVAVMNEHSFEWNSFSTSVSKQQRMCFGPLERRDGDIQDSEESCPDLYTC